MAIPSGGGSEILTRSHENANSGTWVKMIDGGDADHIYTLISLVWCEMAGADDLIGLRVKTDSGDYIQIIHEQTPLPSKGTYIFNDKLCLVGTDELQAYSNSGNVDIYCTYVFQNWE